MSLVGISDTVEKPKNDVQMTEAAAAKIKELAKTNPDARGKYLRVLVKGGGCSGFMYDFKFDVLKDSDIKIEKDGATCLIDPQSLTLLSGSTIDYVDGLTGAGFNIKNPNATGTCGCGSSFST